VGTIYTFYAVVAYRAVLFASWCICIIMFLVLLCNTETFCHCLSVEISHAQPRLSLGLVFYYVTENLRLNYLNWIQGFV